MLLARPTVVLSFLLSVNNKNSVQLPTFGSSSSELPLPSVRPVRPVRSSRLARPVVPSGIDEADKTL